MQCRQVGDLFLFWGAIKGETRTVAVPELMAIVERHRKGRWQLQTPFFWKLAAEILMAANEFTLARELLDEASHIADVSWQDWVKAGLDRLYAVLAQHGASPGGFTPE